MTPGPAPGDADAFIPLNATERQRLGTLLHTVSSRTLLQSLASLYQENEDARLLIAALIERLPADDQAGETPLPA